MSYYKMLHKHGQMAFVPTEEFIELLEYKLEALKKAKEQDSSWNYGIEELEQEISSIKGFVNLLKE